MRALLRIILVVSLTLWALPSLAQDATLAQARQLMSQRDAAAAYKLLKPLEDQRAGDPEFDYLLGIAALDIGRHSEAVFALERVLSVRPDHPQARAEIARAYFQLGEMETARREFEAVRERPIPPEVAATIQRFLDAIEQAQAGTRTTIAGYLDFGLGYDTNVNSGTGTSTIAVPALPGILLTLNPAALEQKDGFGVLGGGVNVRHPLTPKLAVLGGLDFNQRLHPKKTEFDLGNIGGNLGLELNEGQNKFLLALQGQQLYLDWDRFRDSFGAVGQWQRGIGRNGMFTAYLQHVRLEYPGQSIRNADRTVGGIAYAHAFGGTYAPIVFGGLYYGDEDERTSNRPDLGHRAKGLRIGGQLNINARTQVFVFGSYEERDYGGPVPGFVTPRTDRQKDFRVGLSYRPAALWTITPQFSYTDNSSNVPFTNFDRIQAQVTVRRDFR